MDPNLFLLRSVHSWMNYLFMLLQKGLARLTQFYLGTVLFRALQDMYGSKHCVKPPYRNFDGSLTMNAPHRHGAAAKSGL